MRHLGSARRKKLAQEIIRAKRALLIIDYDGTLVPIKPRPTQANLPGSVRTLLRELAGDRRFKVVVLTGRKAREARSKVRLRNVVYAGNHGLEFLEHGKYRLDPRAKAAQGMIRSARKKLEPIVAKFKDAWLENKGSAFTCHYRMVPQDKVPAFKAQVLEGLAPWVFTERIHLLLSKMALEVRPAEVGDKGDAALAIVKGMGPGVPTIFIGDDAPDELAFQALGKRALTVRVGKPRKSHARYYLKDPGEVGRFLSWLVLLRRDI